MRKQKMMIKILIGLFIAICMAITALVMVLNIKSWKGFYEGTTINGIDVSGLSVEEAKTKLSDTAVSYILSVTFRNEALTLDAKTIQLSCDPNADIEAIKTAQSEKKEKATTADELTYMVDGLFTYDTAAVTSALQGTDAMNVELMKAPENASLVYNSSTNAFELKDGDLGTKLDQQTVIDAVCKAIDTMTPSLDIAAAGLYEQAAVPADSEQAQTVLAEANSYLSMQLTYTFEGDASEVIDGKIIGTLLYIDDDGKVAADQDAVTALVEKYAESHSSEKSTSNFTTTAGSVITVDVPSGANVDKNALYEDIMTCLSDKTSGERQAPYATDDSSSANNFGGNYVEVDLTNQSLYLYKNGSRVMSSDIVSGSVSAGHRTPTGVYKVYSMEKNVTLRGADYASPVSYWMPFNGGVGFHDATWRSSFGGSIYLTNGSHGCINMPYANAQTLYNTINTGYYVIVYGGQTSASGSSSNSSSDKSETTESETKKQETSAPETKKPETSAPETKKPETSAPETKKPETSAPETKKPETSAPETKKPETSAPETTAPETTKPETSAPETTKPETSAPETTAAEV